MRSQPYRPPQLMRRSGLYGLARFWLIASGEWIASDWPVCAISETAAPHRMGAALTYARRYALFTLVGIAGEDDLDAPDLVAPTAPASSKAEKPAGYRNGRRNGGQAHPNQQFSRGRPAIPSKPILEPKPSAALRDQLTAELKDLNSAEDAADWAQRVLAAKNTLTTGDAEHVEQAFQEKLASILTEPADGRPVAQEAKSRLPRAGRRKMQRRAAAIDKSVLALPALRRVRDRDHVRLVAKQPCLICGRRPADAHHLRFAQSRALGRKVSDEFTIPLCRGHHREVHRCGDEAAWWKKAGIDPTVPARGLWLQSHPLPGDEKPDRQVERSPNR